MRRLLPFVAAAAALLVLAGAAPAAPQGLTSHRLAGGSGPPAPPEMRAATSWMGHRFVPAHQVLPGGAAINGTALQYGGSAYAGADVGWGVYTDTDGASGYGLTQADGSFSFPDVATATAANGSLWVSPASSAEWFEMWGLSWAAPGPTSFTVQPGRATVSLLRGGPWSYWQYAFPEVYTSQGDSWRYGTNMIASGGSEPTVTGYGYPLPGTVEGAAVYFWMDEGDEIPAMNGQSITAGATLGGTYTVDESTAKRTWTGGWGSGKPGSTARLWIENYPAGWLNYLYGMSDDPQSSGYKTFGTWTSGGTSARSKALTIPAKAKPGYSYYLWLAHDSGPLTLATTYQVCTLNASKTTIRKGGSVKLSGIVPTEGHWGSKAGKSKKVIVYKRTKAAGQPAKKGGFTKWNGWTRVGTYKANGLGKFSTGYLRPSRSTWYVAWYPGDNWYWGAYTSVRKVTVK